MSTFVSEGHCRILGGEEGLAYYFDAFAKPREARRVGIEVELFGVDRVTGKALPYDGPRGIEAILKGLSDAFGYELVYEAGRVIALKRGNSFVTLEPGGQVELSAPPVVNVFEVEQQIQTFLSELREMRQRFLGIEWLAIGSHPFSLVEEAPWVPKKRYGLMADYFKTHGPLSHEMMKLTATNQISFDYLSEEDAMDSLKTVLAISSVVTALFAHSPFSCGRLNSFLTRRLEVWNHTDPDRTGLILQFTEEGRTFRDYLEYLFSLPMIFIVRHGWWIPMKGLPFRKFLKDGFQGIHATLADFELHLSTAFPEARLKQYLEIRGMDCQSPDLIAAVAAFWKGILYDAAARKAAWSQVAFASAQDRLRLHHEVSRKGLLSKLGSEPIFPIAHELVDIACSSLARQTTRDESRDECTFLEMIRRKILRPQKSPAEVLIDEWQNVLGQDPKRLIDHLSIH